MRSVLRGMPIAFVILAALAGLFRIEALLIDHFGFAKVAAGIVLLFFLGLSHIIGQARRRGDGS